MKAGASFESLTQSTKAAGAKDDVDSRFLKSAVGVALFVVLAVRLHLKQGFFRAKETKWTDKYFVLAILILSKHTDKVPEDLHRHLAHLFKVRIIIGAAELYLSRSEGHWRLALSRILRSVHDRRARPRRCTKIPLVSNPTT